MGVTSRAENLSKFCGVPLRLRCYGLDSLILLSIMILKYVFGKNLIIIDNNSMFLENEASICVIMASIWAVSSTGVCVAVCGK